MRLFILSILLAFISVSALSKPKDVLKLFSTQADNAGLSPEGYYHDALDKGDVATLTAMRDAATLAGDIAFFQAAIDSIGAGGFTGPVSSTDNALTRFDGNGGDTVQNSVVTVSDTGVIGGVATPVASTDAANKDYVDTATSGGGDVVGPASSTDNAVPRYDTATGKLLQDSLLVVDDAGKATGLSNLEMGLSLANEIQTLSYDTTPEGGSFVLDIGGSQSSSIAYNANNATIKAAIEAIAGITAVTVTGSFGSGHTVEFTDPGVTDIAQMTVFSNSMEFGFGDPIVVTPATTQSGSTTPFAGNYIPNPTLGVQGKVELQTDEMYILNETALQSIFGVYFYSLNNQGLEFIANNNSTGANPRTNIRMQAGFPGKSDSAIEVSNSSNDNFRYLQLNGDGATVKLNNGDIELSPADGSAIRIKEQGGFDTVGLSAPALAASYNLVLPSDDGEPNQILTTDGTGGLTWTSPDVPIDLTNYVGSSTSPLLSVDNTGVGRTALFNNHGGSSATVTIFNQSVDPFRKALDISASYAGESVSVVNNNSGGKAASFQSSGLTTPTLELSNTNANGPLLTLSANSTTVKVLVPNGTSYNLWLPPNDGEPGQVLQTDGAGVTSWENPRILAKETSAPTCTEGLMFYNTTASPGFPCYCDDAGATKKVSDNTSCF